MALVSARLENRDLGSAVAEIRTRLAQLKLPVGYTYEIGGQYESQRQAFRELLAVFGIAAVLVFTVLVLQFRSFTPSMLILIAAPLSLGGALLLLLVTGTDLNVSSAMGLILLIGLVVKNGIMLMDYTVAVARCRRAIRVGHRPRRTHPAATDSDDDLLYPVRAAAARAGPRRGCRTAEASRAGGDWRPGALDSGHPSRRPGPLRGDQTAAAVEFVPDKSVSAARAVGGGGSRGAQCGRIEACGSCWSRTSPRRRGCSPSGLREQSYAVDIAARRPDGRRSRPADHGLRRRRSST